MKLKIKKILKETANDFSFPVSYVHEDGTIDNFSVFSNIQFRQIVAQLFGSRDYNDWESETEESECIADFVSSFNVWRSTRQDTYGRRMYALSVKFEPLENYRSHEEREGEIKHGEKIELEFDNRKDIQKDDSYVEKTFTNYKESEKDDSYVERSYTNFKEATKDDSYVERSYNQYQESTTVGAQTITNKISADDASAFVNSSQTENGTHTDDKDFSGSYKDANGYTTLGRETTTSGSYKDQNGFDEIGHEKSISGSIKDQHGQTLNGLTNEKTGKETTSHSGTDEDSYTLERYGNIGVTTSQQMLASDLDLLRYDITMSAIREFISTYTYISEEVD